MTIRITKQSIKLMVVATTAIAALVFLQLIPSPTLPEGHAAILTTIEADPPVPTPETLVDNFDKTIQQKFLTAPGFGLARIAPIRPTGPRARHVPDFSASTPAEYASVAAFEKEGWDVGIYLFGRRTELRTDTKKENQYDIRYRLFNPIPVTKGLKRSSFRKQKKLANEAKKAFLEFQDPDSPNANEMKFEIGDWTYIARPVRASNQSCLQCHKDYVITDKIGEGKFTVRPRRLGDVNGVLFYALRKHGAKN